MNSGLASDAYAEYYVERRGCSTMWAESNAWFATYAGGLARVPTRVLSVGSGAGDVDLAWSRVLWGAEEVGGTGRSYVCLEPSEEHFALLEEGTKDESAFECKRTTFEALEGDEGEFDLILFVHSAQWLGDFEASMARARAMLAPGGAVVVCLQGEHGVPLLRECAERFRSAQKMPILTAENAFKRLERAGIAARLEVIPARVDVTEVLAGSMRGRALLSFFINYDVSDADQDEIEPLVGIIEAHADAQDASGKRWMREDIGMIVCYGNDATGS